MNAPAHVYLEDAALCGQIIERLIANWQAIPADERLALLSPCRYLEGKANEARQRERLTAMLRPADTDTAPLSSH